MGAAEAKAAKAAKEAEAAAMVLSLVLPESKQYL